MNETLDQQIAQSLHNDAAHAPQTRGPRFGDVQRRARQRRQRHVVAAVAPTMLGFAWIGMRTASGGTDVQPASAGEDTTVSSTGSSTETTETSPATTSPDTINTVTTSTIGNTVPSDEIGTFVCLDASGGSPDSMAECQAQLGGGMFLTAGSRTDHSFVMALDPAYQSEAEYAANLFGFPIEPLQAPALNGIDLTGTKARVVVVIGMSAPPCTVPNGCGNTAP